MIGLDSLVKAFKIALRSENSNGATVTLTQDTSFTNGALIFVGTGGDLKIDLKGGGTGLTYKNIPSGTFFELLVTKIYSSSNGTTATDIISHVEG